MDGYSTYMEPPKCEFIATWTGGHTELPNLPPMDLFFKGAKPPRNYCSVDFASETDAKDLKEGKCLQKQEPYTPSKTRFNACID